MAKASWYAHIQGNQYGPVTIETFRAWVGEGRIVADTPVWHPGIPEWRTAKDMPELNDLFAKQAVAKADEEPATNQTKAIQNRETEANKVEAEEEYEKTVVAPSPFLAQMLQRDLAKDDESTDDEEQTVTDTDTNESVDDALAENEDSVEEATIVQEANPFAEPESERDTEHETDASTDAMDEATRVMDSEEFRQTIEEDNTVTQQEAINPFASEQDTVMEKLEAPTETPANPEPQTEPEVQPPEALVLPDMNAQPQDLSATPPPVDEQPVPAPAPTNQANIRPSKKLFMTAGIMGIVLGLLYLVFGVMALADDSLGGRAFRNAAPAFGLITLAIGLTFLILCVFTLLARGGSCRAFGIIGVIWSLAAIIGVILQLDVLLLTQGVAIPIGVLSHNGTVLMVFAYLIPVLLLTASILALMGTSQAKSYRAFKRSQ